jgi:hypothetical protein
MFIVTEITERSVAVGPGTDWLLRLTLFLVVGAGVALVFLAARHGK